MGLTAETVVGNPFELGFYRFLVELDLFGAAGASIALECDIALTCAAGTQGLGKFRTEGRTSRQGEGDPKGDASSGTADAKVQGIKGSPTRKKGGVKIQAGAGAEVQALAGINAGIDLKGSVQWLNTEGYLDLSALGRLKPDLSPIPSSTMTGPRWGLHREKSL